jgi:hypothetical protein
VIEIPLFEAAEEAVVLAL